MEMKKKLKMFLAAVAATFAIAGAAQATPSTHIWAPSTDVQPYGVGHLTADMYIPVDKPAGQRPGTITNLGLTVGLLPFEKIGLEAGFDHIEGTYPVYFNAKLGVPEGAYGALFPALAVGGFSFGTKSDATDYNIIYAKAAKTIGNFGRFSAGYYTGNDKLLVDENGAADESGIMLAWERTLTEISDKLWVSIDYMGGDNSFGVLSYGFSWKFAPNTGVIFGYVDQNNDRIAPGDTFTVQVDIDFDLFNRK